MSSKVEKFEQLELPFEGKPKSKSSVKKVPKVTGCMRTWAELRDGNYWCNGCGEKFELLEDYNLHLRKQEEDSERS